MVGKNTVVLNRETVALMVQEYMNAHTAMPHSHLEVRRFAID